MELLAANLNFKIKYNLHYELKKGSVWLVPFILVKNPRERAGLIKEEKG